MSVENRWWSNEAVLAEDAGWRSLIFVDNTSSAAAATHWLDWAGWQPTHPLARSAAPFSVKGWYGRGTDHQGTGVRTGPGHCSRSPRILRGQGGLIGRGGPMSTSLLLS